MVEAQDRPETSEPAVAAKSARGQKLWAVLLVLDSFFVIIFGGALAAKLYQHWQSPAPVARRPKPVAKPAEKAPEPPKQEAKASEPAKPVEPPKATTGGNSSSQPASGKALPAADSPRPPKPSLLHEAPRREAARPQGSSQAAAPSSVPPAQKAVPVDFHYKGSAKRVELVGAFIVRGGRKAMVESAPNTWTLTLYLTPNTYRYHFFVNGKKVLDPDNAKQDRGMSVLTVAPAAQ